MNYHKHYELLISKASQRTRDANSYYEMHHILPRCMGGIDDDNNLVALTPEEHYLAHQLLVKMYPYEYGLVIAVKRMTDGARRNNKWYGWLRRRFAAAMSESQTGMNNSQFGSKWITNGTQNKKIHDGASLPIGWRYGRGDVVPKQKRLTRPKYFGRKMSEQNKLALIEANKGKPKSIEHRRKISESMKGNSNARVV